MQSMFFFSSVVKVKGHIKGAEIIYNFYFIQRNILPLVFIYALIYNQKANMLLFHL